MDEWDNKQQTTVSSPPQLDEERWTLSSLKVSAAETKRSPTLKSVQSIWSCDLILLLAALVSN